MADPPWDIHMELPYGTMTDDEMKNMRIRELSDDGLFFLWVSFTQKFVLKFGALWSSFEVLCYTFEAVQRRQLSDT